MGQTRAVRVHVKSAGLRGYATPRVEHETANLRLALTSNRHTGMALGVRMHRDKITSDEGLAQLRVTSQRLNRKPRDIGDEVMFTGKLRA